MIQFRSYFCFKLRVSGILLIRIYNSYLPNTTALSQSNCSNFSCSSINNSYLPNISQRNRWSRKFLVLLVLLISVLKLFWNISKVFCFKSSQFLLILNSKASHNRAILRKKQRKIAQKSFPRSCIIYSKLVGMWSVSFLSLLFVAKCK